MATTDRGEVAMMHELQQLSSHAASYAAPVRVPTGACAQVRPWTGSTVTPSRPTAGDTTASGAVDRGFDHLGANGCMDGTFIARRRPQETPT